MVYLYDNSIIEDLRAIFSDNRITICPSEMVFRVIGRLNEDDIKFPMISVTRTGWSILDSQHTMRFTGGLLSKDQDEATSDTIQMIPIRINYLIDVWTQHREENDNILRELIFYYMTHPTLQVTIPYKADVKHNFNIFFDSQVEDNSDINDQMNHGEYFRQTVSVYTDDAYLWNTRTNKLITVADFDLYICDKGKEILDS